MHELQQFCTTFKQGFTPEKQDPTQPVHCWSEKEIFDNKIVDAFVMILRTRGCAWSLQSGCTMCGYHTDSMWQKIPDEHFIQQIDHAMKKYHGEPVVKIFTSGSFLDNTEINPKIRNMILTKLSETTQKISVESRPEYITEATLSEVKENIPLTEFEIGIGLETANDFIREYAINKGFSFKDYQKAAIIMKKYDTKIKTYVLFKPPFLTEQEAINDCIITIKKIKKDADTISLNPTNVQRHTLVDYLWKRRQYRPPWLWSVVEIIRQGKKQFNGRIKCDVVGGGSIRGAHNCKTCDHTILNALSDFSLTQNLTVFDNLSCICNEQWLDQLDSEALTFGSYIDFSEAYR
jgi:archaeosine synthase beta-subunit